jgi:putative hemolysin
MARRTFAARTAPLAVIAALASAQVFSCGTPSASEDERGSIGVPTPPAAYCKAAGGTLVGSDCVFADGTRCEQWSFWRAQCGQAHSYCSQHGGVVSTATQDAGTFTTVSAVCTLNGRTCDEDRFSKDAVCP